MCSGAGQIWEGVEGGGCSSFGEGEGPSGQEFWGEQDLGERGGMEKKAALPGFWIWEKKMV